MFAKCRPPAPALAGLLLLAAAPVNGANPDPAHIYRIVATDCAFTEVRDGASRRVHTVVQTGFRLQGDPPGAIRTAIHGVVGCGSVEARNDKTRKVYELVPVLPEREEYPVDFQSDTVLLLPRRPTTDDTGLVRAPELKSPECQTRYDWQNVSELFIWGYSEKTPLTAYNAGLLHPPVVRLGDLGNHMPVRNSPDPRAFIVQMDRAEIGQGISGGPVVNQKGEVVAMIIGGRKGSPWAVPLGCSTFKSAAAYSAQLKALVNAPRANLYTIDVTSRRCRSDQKDLRAECAFVTIGPEDSEHVGPKLITTEVQGQGFWIGSTEVTIQDYEVCVQNGPCARSGMLELKRGAEYPVSVSATEHAEKYCGWLGGRLPTEAEWTIAAKRGFRTPELDFCESNLRGTSRKRGCPTDLDDQPGLMRAAAFPSSAIGTYDLFGNLWELVDTGKLMGGDYTTSARDLTEWHAKRLVPFQRVGFRCVMFVGSEPKNTSAESVQ